MMHSSSSTVFSRLSPAVSRPLPHAHFVFSGTTPPTLSLSLIISDSPPPFSSPLSSWLPFFLPSCVFVYSIGPVRLTLIACKNPATESSDRLPKRKIKNQRLWNWIKLFLLFLVVKVYNSGFDWQRPGLTFMTLLTLYPLPSQRLI